MKTNKRLQWQASVVIGASLAKVWAAFEDLSLIPEYHPIVRKVEFPSGMQRRAPGVEYKCVVPEGPRQGWCVEKVVEHVPLQRSTVAFTADSWGLGALLEDFVTEITVEAASGGRTRATLRGFYTPRGWRGVLLNPLIVRRTMRRRAEDTLRGFQSLLERS